jgi:hypothetical protein
VSAFALLTAGLATALVAVATLAARWWGHGIGGLLSAFPLIVGPVLVIAAQRHGASFAADTADATLAGLVALSGFALAYGRSAVRRPWRGSLLLAWAVAAALGTAAGRFELGLLGGVVVAVLSIAVAWAGLPARRGAAGGAVLPGWELALRMALTAVLILVLTAAGNRFGSTVAGALAALPTLASVLAVFTHARYGSDAVLELLRGMLGGMTAFVTFCALVSGLLESAGAVAAFAIATAGAVLAQAAAARAPALGAIDDPADSTAPAVG